MLRITTVVLLLSSVASAEFFAVHDTGIFQTRINEHFLSHTDATMMVERIGDQIRVASITVSSDELFARTGRSDWVTVQEGNFWLGKTKFDQVEVFGVLEHSQPINPEFAFRVHGDANGNVEFPTQHMSMILRDGFNRVLYKSFKENPQGPDYPDVPDYIYQWEGEDIREITAPFQLQNTVLGDPLLAGDADLDGDFDSDDLIEAFSGAKYDALPPPPPGLWAVDWTEGDWNGDDLFNSDDLILAFSEGNYEQPASVAVPEPHSLALALLGLLALLPANPHHVRCRSN